MELKYKVTGMACSGCVDSVEKAVTALKGVDCVTVSLETGELVVTGESFNAKAPVKAVKKAGFVATTL